MINTDGDGRYSPHDGASVLACAYQLKVRSKNPKNFEHWFLQSLMSKIRNISIKHKPLQDGECFLTYA